MQCHSPSGNRIACPTPTVTLETSLIKIFAIVGFGAVFGKSADCRRKVRHWPRFCLAPTLLRPNFTPSHFLLSLTPQKFTTAQRNHARTVQPLRLSDRSHFHFWQAEIGVEHLFVELLILDLFRVLRSTVCGTTNATCLRPPPPRFHSDNLLTTSLTPTLPYSPRSVRRVVYGLGV